MREPWRVEGQGYASVSSLSGLHCSLGSCLCGLGPHPDCGLREESLEGKPLPFREVTYIILTMSHGNIDTCPPMAGKCDLLPGDPTMLILGSSVTKRKKWGV